MLIPDVKLELERAVQAPTEIRPDGNTGRAARAEDEIRMKIPSLRKYGWGKGLRDQFSQCFYVANVARQVAPKC